MTNKDWLKMMEEKEEEILEKLEELYLQAAHNHDENFGSFAADNSLILDDDGELYIVKESPNSMDGRVYDGRAIYIATLKDFDMWEAEDETEWIQNELGDRYPEFERTVLQEKGYYPTLDILREIDLAVYQRIIDDMAFQVKSIDAPEWAQGKFDQKIAELKEEL
jgi:hypothetical protein